MYAYLAQARACVNRNDIELYSSKSVTECAEICSADPQCRGFEYGVDHGGQGIRYSSGDCQPQSSSDTTDCDGLYWNVDFYEKVYANDKGLFFHMSIWKGVEGLWSLPNMELLGQPTLTVQSFSVNYNEAAFNGLDLFDNFVVRWTGTMSINAGGMYTFYATSDDGSKVYIRDELVVNHDGTHGATEATGSIFLSQGGYSVVVDYFQGIYGAEMYLKYSGPDTNSQKIYLTSTPLSSSLVSAGTTGAPTGATVCSNCIAGKFPVLLALTVAGIELVLISLLT